MSGPIIDTTVIGSVLTWAEGHAAFELDDERIPVGLEDMPAGVPSVMVATMPGDPYVRRYKSGGYIASWPFGVYLRTDKAADTAARIDATRVLGDVQASIDDKASWPVAPEGYEYTGFEVTTTPARISENEDGTADYQMTLELTYYRK